VDVPQPGPGAALVRQTAVGVNNLDIYHRAGTFLVPFELPAKAEPDGQDVVYKRRALDANPSVLRLCFINDPHCNPASVTNARSQRHQEHPAAAVFVLDHAPRSLSFEPMPNPTLSIFATKNTSFPAPSE
jgi:hypothetical protein